MKLFGGNDEEREEREVKTDLGRRIEEVGINRSDSSTFLLPFSALCLSPSVVIVASGPVVGGGGALTGACSDTNPVARGEEWPRFPPPRLILSTRLAAALVCVPVISGDI